ncbi:MAG: tRNA lysidine(34) synthetase TilS [bacterium]|nr:tRNA lysidine(34) synthetase TilS [bacterium]
MDRADERPRGGLTPLRAAIAAGAFEPYLRRCNFPPPPAAVTCAVSGGADSLALLVLATAAGLEVTAVYVDHGIRPNSADDARTVAAAATAAGAGFGCETVAVTPGPNLEARARSARYGALPPGALVGHTADDQAETVLLNLLRGAGPAGVAAMWPTRRRPLLSLRRADTVEVCRLAGLVPVLDESNLDPAIRRNRVRHDVLPLLEEVFERDVTPLLCRHADLARETTEALDAAVAGLDPRDCAALAAAPRALARWALRRWITGGRGVTPTGDRHPPDLAAVDRALAVALGEARAADVGGGRRGRRSAQRLHLEATASPPRRLPD